MDLSRNYLFISDEVQAKIRDCKILIIGVGLGSVIAEALVRIGVTNLCICDGDVVSESNLNRQNYGDRDINHLKTKALETRLLAINPDVNIKTVDHFVNEDHMIDLIPQYDFIVNTIDFDSPAFFSCHELCKRFGKVEFFPMNLGFGFGLFVFKETFFDESFSKEKIIDYVISRQTQSEYIKEKLLEYMISRRDYDPQLIVGALGNAAMVCSVLCSVLSEREVKTFPSFYFTDFNSI